MFYEIEMLPEYIDSCVGMLKDVENKENITYHFTWNESEYFEKVDTSIISKESLRSTLFDQIVRIKQMGANVIIQTKDNNSPVYNIADYRRDLNYNY